MAIITAPNIGDLICVQNWAQLCSSHFSKTLQKYNCELCTPYIIIILCTISAMTVSQGKDEYLGETRSAPVVQLDFTDQKVELKWLELKREGESAGELLAAFELVLNEGEMKVSFPMDERGEYNQIVVPEGIAPHMEEYTVEVIL